MIIYWSSCWKHLLRWSKCPGDVQILLHNFTGLRTVLTFHYSNMFYVNKKEFSFNGVMLQCFTTTFTVKWTHFTVHFFINLKGNAFIIFYFSFCKINHMKFDMDIVRLILNRNPLNISRHLLSFFFMTVNMRKLWMCFKVTSHCLLIKKEPDSTHTKICVVIARVILNRIPFGNSS